MIASRVLSAVSLTLLSCLAACTSSVDSAESTAHARSAIIKGTSSTSAQDSVVLLVHYDPSSPGVGSCSGTLLAPNLILTARHCVSDTDESAACKPDGTPIAQGAVRSDHPPNTLYVFKGAQRPDFSGLKPIVPDGKGKKIIDDGTKNLCNHDIALLLLEAPIKDAHISPIRLDGDVEVGDLITAIGWGVTDKTPMPSTRQQRKDIKIINVGPNSVGDPVPPHEFEVGESICSGDSGGPAVTQDTSTVVGLVSRGGNASTSTSNDPAAHCVGSDTRNLYTKTSAFKDLILSAYELAGQDPWIEGGPDPRKAKAKEACSTDDDCRSALCLPDPDAGGDTTCAEDCSETAACTVDGDVCTAEGDYKVCRAPKPVAPVTTTTTTTCTTSSPGRSGAGSGAAVVFGVLALASLRRRKSVRS